MAGQREQCVENNSLEIKGEQRIQEAGRQVHRAPDLARCDRVSLLCEG